MFRVGSICRSKDPILRCDDDDDSRLCRVISVLPEHRWRTAGVPEYKVELVALPVTAFRRHTELVLLPPTEAPVIRTEAFAV